MLIEPSASRDRLTAGIYTPDSEDDITGRLHHAMAMSIRSEPIERKLRDKGKIYHPDQPFEAWLGNLVSEQILNSEEADLLKDTRSAVRTAIMVDDFPADEWG